MKGCAGYMRRRLGHVMARTYAPSSVCNSLGENILVRGAVGVRLPDDSIIFARVVCFVLFTLPNEDGPVFADSVDLPNDTQLEGLRRLD